jgi:predicted small secreted protein
MAASVFCEPAGTPSAANSFPGCIDTGQSSRKENIVRKLATGLLIALTTLSLAACNTVQGFGRDVEEAGETVQDSAD